MNVLAKPWLFNPRQAFHSRWEFCYQNLVLQRGASGAFQVEKMNLRMSQKLKTSHGILGLLVLEAHVTCSRHQEDMLRRVMHGVKDICLHTSRLPHKHLSRCPRPTTPPHWATTQWGRNTTYACIGNCGRLSEWNRVPSWKAHLPDVFTLWHFWLLAVHHLAGKWASGFQTCKWPGLAWGLPKDTKIPTAPGFCWIWFLLTFWYWRFTSTQFWSIKFNWQT